METPEISVGMSRGTSHSELPSRCWRQLLPLVGKFAPRSETPQASTRGRKWNVLDFPRRTAARARARVLHKPGPMVELGQRAINDVDRHLRAIRTHLAIHASDLIDAQGARRHLDVAVVERVKKDFLSLISHALCTALNGIRGTLDLVDQHASAGERDEAITSVRQSYDRLESLVNRGLAYFDWLASEPGVVEAATDLEAVAGSIHSWFPGLQDAHVSFRMTRSEAPCVAAIDRRHLVEVLRILLENALEFSTGPVDIHLDMRRVGAEIRVSVTDGGRGFPAGFAEELFGPFSVADPAHHWRGTGLGLALARSIVEAHRGRMGATSSGRGRGATFTVHLPVHEGVAPRALPFVPQAYAARAAVAMPMSL